MHAQTVKYKIFTAASFSFHSFDPVPVFNLQDTTEEPDTLTNASAFAAAYWIGPNGNYWHIVYDNKVGFVRDNDQLYYEGDKSALFRNGTEVSDDEPAIEKTIQEYIDARAAMAELYTRRNQEEARLDSLGITIQGWKWKYAEKVADAIDVDVTIKNRSDKKINSVVLTVSGKDAQDNTALLSGRKTIPLDCGNILPRRSNVQLFLQTFSSKTLHTPENRFYPHPLC